MNLINIDFTPIISVWATLLGAIVAILLTLYTAIVVYLVQERRNNQDVRSTLATKLNSNFNLTLTLEELPKDFKSFFDKYLFKSIEVLYKSDCNITKGKKLNINYESYENFKDNIKSIIICLKDGKKNNSKFLTIYNSSNLADIQNTYNLYSNSEKRVLQYKKITNTIRIINFIALIPVLLLVFSSFLNTFEEYYLSYIFTTSSIIIFFSVIIFLLLISDFEKIGNYKTLIPLGIFTFLFVFIFIYFTHPIFFKNIDESKYNEIQKDTIIERMDNTREEKNNENLKGILEEIKNYSLMSGDSCDGNSINDRIITVNSSTLIDTNKRLDVKNK